MIIKDEEKERAKRSSNPNQNQRKVNSFPRKVSSKKRKQSQ